MCRYNRSLYRESAKYLSIETPPVSLKQEGFPLFDMKLGYSLTQMIAEKDGLISKIAVYKDVAHEGSMTTHRARNTEIKIKSTISVANWHSEIDEMSKKLRLLDNQLQQSNWTTELIE